MPQSSIGLCPDRPNESNKPCLSHSLHERCFHTSNGQDLLVSALCASLQISPLQAFPSSDSGISSSELESGKEGLIVFLSLLESDSCIGIPARVCDNQIILILIWKMLTRW